MNKMGQTADTIYACATGIAAAGVAVFRVSGPEAAKTIEALTGGSPPPPRLTHLRKIKNPSTGEIFDQALILFFKAPHSFTGEDVAEFHTHGGRAIREATLSAFSKITGLRAAEPGEFTRRAFENGKLDLTEAEAIADLVAAETEQQRRQAFRQSQGELSALYENWRGRIMGILANTEAAIDFADEDLPSDLADAQTDPIQKLVEEMRAHLQDGHRGERLRDGIHIAILGAPNVGKSSLLNRLARRDAAIVSATAGTTRDVVEVSLDLSGWPITLADTAGLREAEEEIEAEGIRRSRARAREADLKILVLDAAHLDPQNPDMETLDLFDQNSILVINKLDSHPDIVSQPIRLPNEIQNPAILYLSAQTGDGIADLIKIITEKAQGKLGEDSGTPPLTKARHREAIEEAEQALSRALKASEQALRAEDLRHAATSIGRATGRIEAEELLDKIFRDFCIGK